jgi:hypothetical protein
VPILVRPVREQLEHDRVIRLLEAKYRRKFHVDINPGDERHAPVKAGPVTLFPDLVLSDESGRKPYAVVEVETGESVNHLEAMSQWANLAKSKAYLYLYVPAGSVDSAKRLCADHQISVTELTSYLSIGDQVRFTTVTRVPTPEPLEKRKAAEKPSGKKGAAVEKTPPVDAMSSPPVDLLDRAAGSERTPKPDGKPEFKTEKPRAEKLVGLIKVANGGKASSAKADKKVASAAKRPATSSRAAPAAHHTVTPKRRPGEASARRAGQSAKRAAASRTATRGATKRTPARAAQSKASQHATSKPARAQKRK